MSQLSIMSFWSTGLTAGENMAPPPEIPTGSQCAFLLFVSSALATRQTRRMATEDTEDTETAADLARRPSVSSVCSVAISQGWPADTPRARPAPSWREGLPVASIEQGMDNEIRKLERRVLENDPGAREALERARGRAGVGRTAIIGCVHANL